MNTDAKLVLDDALELVDAERRQVTEAPLDNLAASMQVELRRAWRDEILRRVEQVRTGEVELEAWDDVRRLGREAVARR